MNRAMIQTNASTVHPLLTSVRVNTNLVGNINGFTYMLRGKCKKVLSISSTF